MKKINILLIAAAVFTSSLHNTFATEYLNHSEKQAVTKVGNKIITTINNQWWCNTELYNSVSVKLVTLHDGFISDSYWKKAEIISVIQTMLYDQWWTCSSTVDEENIDDLISEVVTTKRNEHLKSTFEQI